MLNAAKSVASKQLAAGSKMLVPTQLNAFSGKFATDFGDSPAEKATLTMVTEESKHRMKLPLYDLDPYVENCWIAPNSVVGKYKSLY